LLLLEQESKQELNSEKDSGKMNTHFVSLLVNRAPRKESGNKEPLITRIKAIREIDMKMKNNYESTTFRRRDIKLKSNIATLTEKYAAYLFHSAQLDRHKDSFTKEHFFNLIQEHPSLFNVYLTGFHTYVWQVDD
jgi:hypothetical protein